MQINRLYLFVSQCITAKSVKVVKAKTTILQGARVHARARNLDFIFVKLDGKVSRNDFRYVGYLARIYKKLLHTFKIEVCRVYPHFS